MPGHRLLKLMISASLDVTSKLHKYPRPDVTRSEETLRPLQASLTQGWADRKMPQTFRPLLPLHAGCDVLQEGHCIVLPLHEIVTTHTLLIAGGPHTHKGQHVCLQKGVQDVRGLQQA